MSKLSKNDESKSPKDYDPTKYIRKNSWLFFPGGNHQGKSHTNDLFINYGSCHCCCPMLLNRGILARGHGNLEIPLKAKAVFTKCIWKQFSRKAKKMCKWTGVRNFIPKFSWSLHILIQKINFSRAHTSSWKWLTSFQTLFLAFATYQEGVQKALSYHLN